LRRGASSTPKNGGMTPCLSPRCQPARGRGFGLFDAVAESSSRPRNTLRGPFRLAVAQHASFLNSGNDDHGVAGVIRAWRAASQTRSFSLRESTARHNCRGQQHTSVHAIRKWNGITSESQGCDRAVARTSEIRHRISGYKCPGTFAGRAAIDGYRCSVCEHQYHC